MRLLEVSKDGGPDSYVTGLYLIEIKSPFSIVLLKFAKGTRETFHNHAFNALTLWLSGLVHEEYPLQGTFPDGWTTAWYPWQWKYTPRNMMHRVRALKDSYAISFRGPWKKTWQEYDPITRTTSILSNGRTVTGTIGKGPFDFTNTKPTWSKGD